MSEAESVLSRRLAEEKEGDSKMSELLNKLSSVRALQTQLELGQQNLTSGDVAGALACFGQAAALSKRDPNIQLWQSRAQLARGTGSDQVRASFDYVPQVATIFSSKSAKCDGFLSHFLIKIRFVSQIW